MSIAERKRLKKDQDRMMQSSGTAEESKTENTNSNLTRFQKQSTISAQSAAAESEKQ